MKITKSMYYCESHESEDLYLYIVNDGDLYFEIVSACKTLAKHLKKHEYNKDKAIGYYYVVKHNEVNQQLVFVTGGRRTKKKTEMVCKNFQSTITYILKLTIQK